MSCRSEGEHLTGGKCGCWVDSTRIGAQCGRDRSSHRRLSVPLPKAGKVGCSMGSGLRADHGWWLSYCPEEAKEISRMVVRSSKPHPLDFGHQASRQSRKRMAAHRSVSRAYAQDGGMGGRAFSCMGSGAEQDGILPCPRSAAEGERPSGGGCWGLAGACVPLRASHASPPPLPWIPPRRREPQGWLVCWWRPQPKGLTPLRGMGTTWQIAERPGGIKAR
jgi:hypothetical protein